MTKTKLLFTAVGIYIGLCIGTFVGLNNCHKPHRDDVGWYEYKLVVDADDEADLPYYVYDRNGDTIGKISAQDLDNIIH